MKKGLGGIGDMREFDVTSTTAFAFVSLMMR